MPLLTRSQITNDVRPAIRVTESESTVRSFGIEQSIQPNGLRTQRIRLSLPTNSQGIDAFRANQTDM